MSNIPTPIRAVLGLAATAMEEARKLPETLPQVPVVAVTTAMQASLRVQQHIAALAAKGDELLSQLRGTSSEAPSWATFDDSPAATGSSGATPGNGHRGTAAFDRVDADEPPDAEEAAGRFEVGGSFDIAEIGGTDPVTKAARRAQKSSTAKASTGKARTAKSSPAKARATTAPAASDDPTSPIMAAGSVPATKPARKKPVKRSEPLEVAAKKAKPAATPNPATMAAEIVAAHEAETQSAASQQEAGPGDPPAAGTQPTESRQAESGNE